MRPHSEENTTWMPNATNQTVWQVVSHPTPYTLHYSEGTPFIRGPLGSGDGARSSQAKTANTQPKRKLPKAFWWKSVGIAITSMLVTLTFTWPVAQGSSTASGTLMAQSIIDSRASKLGQTSHTDGSSTVFDNSRTIAAYADPKAFATISTVAKEDSNGVSFLNPDGSIVYYSKSNSTHVYLAYKTLAFQIEISDQVPGAAVHLATTPGIVATFFS